MEAELKEAIADEEKAVAGYLDIKAANEKEMGEHAKMRDMEAHEISEAVGKLNDDDALDVLKSLPSSLVQTVGFLQKADAKASRARKTQAILEGVALKAKEVHLILVIYTLGSKLKMKSGTFEEIRNGKGRAARGAGRLELRCSSGLLPR